MLKERVELKLGRVTEEELEYGLERITFYINNADKLFNNDLNLYDILIESIMERRNQNGGV